MVIFLTGPSGVGKSTAIGRTLALLERLHRQVVVLNRSVPGLLVNRFAQALFRESIYLIEQGVTTAADIDRAVKYAVGMRYASIGLLEYFDAVGFQLESTIARNVYPDLCGTTELQKTVLDGLASGETGQAAGRGLYDWSEKDQDDFRRRKQSPIPPAPGVGPVNPQTITGEPAGNARRLSCPQHHASGAGKAPLLPPSRPAGQAVLAPALCKQHT